MASEKIFFWKRMSRILKKCAPYGVLFVFVTVLCVACGAIILKANETFFGNGGATNPNIPDVDEGFAYIDIYTRADLEAVANDPTGIYRLKNDIDLSGNEFTPLGSIAAPFRGIFEGNNKTIRGLTITKEEINANVNKYLGLFAIVQGDNTQNPARIQNLTLENATIKGYELLGALAGSIQSYSTIRNIHAQNVDIRAGDAQSGGIVGFMSGVEASLKQSSSSGSISAPYFAGGIIGSMIEGELLESYSSMTISLRNNGAVAGGLVGSIISDTVIISDSYAIGTINSATTSSGGLVGRVQGKISIVNSYSRTTVPNLPENGHLIGAGMGKSTRELFTLRSCYYLDDMTLTAIGLEGSHVSITSVEGYAFRSNELRNGADRAVTQNDFVGFDFTNIWRWDGNGKWPALQWQQ